MVETSRDAEGNLKDRRENRGLVDKLKDMLIEKRDPDVVKAEQVKATERQARIESDAAEQERKLAGLEQITGETRAVSQQDRNYRPAPENPSDDVKTEAS